jgi:hypothetical protein
VADLNQKFDKLIGLMSQLLDMESEEAAREGGDEAPEQQMQEEETGIEEIPEKIEDPAEGEIPGVEDEEEKIGKKPGSVAFQLESLEKKISGIKKELKNMYKPHRMANPNGSILEKSTVQKYQDKPISVQKVAREASDAWKETSQHPNGSVATKFQAMWPNQEKFVDNVVKMEEIDPGYFKRMTM